MRPILDVEPVRKVQSAYFELLRRNFGHLYKEMQKHEITPAQLAAGISADEAMVSAFARGAHALAQEFVEFWSNNEETVNGYLRKAEMMKSFFGGDISPIVELSHLSATLLYTDTMVVQCPVLRLLTIINVGAPEEAFRLLIKHSLNVMRFEEAATADVEPPILLMTGSRYAVSDDYRQDLHKVSEVYELAQAKALLGTEFKNTVELQEFLSSLKTPEQAIQAIADPNRALFDTEWSGSIDEQFRRRLKEQVETLRLPGVSAAGFILHSLISGRMIQANEIVLLNASIRATPLLSAPTSWQYLLWRYEFDAQVENPGIDPKDLIITNAIVTRGDRNEIPLISGLSLPNIVALRREGALAPLREIMHSSVQRIDAATQSNLKEISDDVRRQLAEAFDKHDRELAALSAGKKKFYGIDVITSIATATLSIAGAATGHTGLATAGALSAAILGSKPLTEFRDQWKDIRSKTENIKRSPTAVLLRNIER